MSPTLYLLSLRFLASLAESDLTRMNDQLSRVNSVAAQLAWREAIEPSPELRGKRLRLAEVSAEWRNAWCRKLRDGDAAARASDLRQVYLLCRGPKYTAREVRELSETIDRLRSAYLTRKVCREDGTCFSGEPDLERLMATSRDPEVLLWAWIEWRNAVGESSKGDYARMVEILNIGARNNGYREIGECWREELEAGDLERLVQELYEEVRPLYLALHAVVRYRLSQYYGSDLVSLEEGIPSHLLGNMWGENWSPLADLLMNPEKDRNLTASLTRKNYTVTDMAKRAEDFYLSLGFKPMTDDFWRHSKWVRTERNGSVCHPTAANMYKRGDFRMILCAEVNEEDFKVIHHEMGHIEYYMEYDHQPAIFQEGTNSAFQEAIGDAITYGVMTSTHLQRLGLIPEVDDSSDADLRHLLHQALSKLPRIPFALALEKWRWGVFRGDIPPDNYNEAWWYLTERYHGLKPPVPRSEDFFDPAAKFHVSDNTPYIRYFLSSILEVQIFEALCKGAIFGYDGLNKSLPIPLHRCDIYGAKEGAEKLREVMSLGRSISWSRALAMVTGERTYSTRPLMEYYRPLHKWLAGEIRRLDIPVGW